MSEIEHYDVADAGAEGQESAEFFRRGHGDAVEVTVYVFRDAEGSLTIQVDTTNDERTRVFLNDGSIFDQDTSDGTEYGNDATRVVLRNVLREWSDRITEAEGIDFGLSDDADRIAEGGDYGDYSRT